MQNRQTLESIQALRALAATLVVILHCRVYLDARNIIGDIGAVYEMGRAGVDIFFVISGFIMVYVTKNAFQKPNASKDFIIKRFIRIAPVYWSYTLVISGFLVFAPHLFSDGKSLDIMHLIGSLAFLPVVNDAGGLKPVLQPGWTLNYEMYFYLIVGLLLPFSKKYFLPVLGSWFIGCSILGALLQPSNAFLSFYSNPILLEFLAGAIIASAYIRGVKFPYPTLWLTAGIVFITATIFIDTSTSYRWIKWGLPGALLVVGCISLEQFRNISLPKWIVRLGDSSYSLYLSHIFTINGLGFIWNKLIGDHYDLFLIITIIVSIIVGHIAYLLYETPVVSFLTKLQKGRSQ